MTDVSNIETPQDVIELDELEIPDWMGIVSPIYLECTFKATLRIWDFFQEENIDTGLLSQRDLDKKYRNEMYDRLSGLGISSLQFTGATNAALKIHRDGFDEWYNNLMDNSIEYNLGNNTLERKWSMKIDPSMDDHDLSGLNMTLSHVEQQLYSNGIDETINYIDRAIKQTKNGNNDESNDETEILNDVRSQLKNGTYEPKLVIMPK